MNILSLDTASPRPAVCLLAGGLVSEQILAPDRRASEELLPAIRRLLAAAALAPRDIGRIAVCAGPGSFTGARVGLATAWGLARAGDLPVEAVSTLEAMAEAARSAGVARVVTALDAGRGELVCARFRLDGPRAEAVGGAQRLTPADVRRFAAGDALVALPAELVGSDGAEPGALPASALALAAARAPRPDSATGIQAIYSRPSAAQEKHGAA